MLTAHLPVVALILSSCFSPAVVGAHVTEPVFESSGADAVAELRAHLQRPVDDRPTLSELAFATAPLSRAQADEAGALLWDDYLARIAQETEAEWRDGRVVLGDDTMRLLVRRFGSAPHGRRSLWISLHGGGGAPPEVNDQQWRNQIRLYQPAEGVYIAPRALQNTWDLWHEPRIDRFFARLIECAVAHEGVDPDRVYLLGYSAGGDGLYRLGPRLADRLAAASMMAGHPGDASPLSLRNLPFAVQVGAGDTPYERNIRAREWGEKLADLHAADPGGYPHLVRIHEGLGHWMQLRDAFVLEWMARYARTAWPHRVVWRQHGVTHPRFYWLGVEGDDLRAGTTIVAQRSADRSGPVGRGPVGRGGQGIEIVEADVTALVLWLHDALVDLDEPLIVTFGDRTLFEGRVDRTIEALAASLDARRDPRLMASARLPLQLAQEPEDRDRAGAEPALGHWSPTTAGEMNDAQRAQMKEALQARDMMFSRLVATLGQVLARPAPDGGPVAAISVCRHEAPKIAGAVSAERRVKIGRISARLRNPENRAPAWAAALIGDTLEDDQEPQDFPVARFATHLDGSLGGVMPIRTLATCLACHGPAETLDPELRAALGAEYPTDRAVGYRENELRGWFWVEVPPR